MDQFGVSWEERVDFRKLRTERLSRARGAMKKHNLDALIVFKVDNIRYLTSLRPLMWEAGYMTRNAALLPSDGEPILFVASGDYQRVNENMPWLRPENRIPLASLEDPGVSKTTVKEKFKTKFDELHVSQGRIGTDLTTFFTLRHLREELPDAVFCDGDKAMKEARMLKTEEETELIKTSSTMVDAGTEAAMGAIHVGIREDEVAGKGLQVLYALGCEWAPFNPVVASGENTVPLRTFSTDKVIRHGDTAVVQMSGMYDGYCATEARTILPTKASQAQKKACQGAREVLEACVSMLSPGRTVKEVIAAAHKAAKEADCGGYLSKGPLGRGIGLGINDLPYVGEEFADMQFQSGMIVALEPSIQIPRVAGAKAGDVVLISEVGPQRLTLTPYDTEWRSLQGDLTNV